MLPLEKNRVRLDDDDDSDEDKVWGILISSIQVDLRLIWKPDP